MTQKSVSLYVRVDGHCYSNHRNPRGVYSVEVAAGRNIRQSACAALELARDHIPFMAENSASLSMRVFSEDGHEVTISHLLSSSEESGGCYRGRSKAYPQSIMA